MVKRIFHRTGLLLSVFSCLFIQSLVAQDLPIEYTYQPVRQPVYSPPKFFRAMENGMSFLQANRLTIGGEKGLLEWRPVTQAISYNEMEGLRLKASGNTTLEWNKHWQLAGYVAYGLKDKQFKYRGDVLYSFLAKEKYIQEFPKRLLHFTYISDLNIPGQDLLTSRRDEFLRSFTHSGTHSMSWQKLSVVSYEHEWENRLSFQVGGKYLYEQPRGEMQYIREGQIVPSLTTAELNFSLRYAPGEIFRQKHENRVYIRQSDVEINLNHRTGLKGIAGSGYQYQITEASIDKPFTLPQDASRMAIRLSAGKVWNRVPFPLLFIPAGNQSYIFEENDYNLMNFYEFTTDRYVAGNFRMQFNWSPFNLLYNSSVKTDCGIKMLYAPLSDNNRPELHPELFTLPPEIQALGEKPYTELHAGLSNILQTFRIEWVQRLTSPVKGSIFVSGGFSF